VRGPAVAGAAYRIRVASSTAFVRSGVAVSVLAHSASAVAGLPGVFAVVRGINLFMVTPGISRPGVAACGLDLLPRCDEALFMPGSA